MEYGAVGSIWGHPCMKYLPRSMYFFFLVSLRSRTFTKATVCRKNTSLALPGSFTLAGPQIWNQLPVDVRECTNFAMFKSKLKTFHSSMLMNYKFIYTFYLFENVLIFLYL